MAQQTSTPTLSSWHWNNQKCTHTHTHTHSDHAMQRNADCGCHNALDLAPSPNALIEYVLMHVHRNFVLNFSPLHRVVRKTCAVDVLNAVLKLPLFRDGQITPPFVIELQITTETMVKLQNYKLVIANYCKLLQITSNLQITRCNFKM